MKKITALLATTMLVCNLQAQSVVTDPNALAQRFALAAQQMEEMVEQKYKFVEQINLMKKQCEDSKTMKERYGKVSKSISRGNEMVGIIEEAEKLMQLNKDIRNSILNKNNSLSDETVMAYVDLLVEFTSEISEKVKEAKKTINDNKELMGSKSNEDGKESEDGHQMSDAERIERLRQIREDLRSIHDNIAMIYQRLNRINVNNSRQHFIHTLY